MAFGCEKHRAFGSSFVCLSLWMCRFIIFRCKITSLSRYNRLNLVFSSTMLCLNTKEKQKKVTIQACIRNVKSKYGRKMVFWIIKSEVDGFKASEWRGMKVRIEDKSHLFFSRPFPRPQPNCSSKQKNELGKNLKTELIGICKNRLNTCCYQKSSSTFNLGWKLHSIESIRQHTEAATLPILW